MKLDTLVQMWRTNCVTMTMLQMNDVTIVTKMTIKLDALVKRQSVKRIETINKNMIIMNNYNLTCITLYIGMNDENRTNRSPVCSHSIQFNSN